MANERPKEYLKSHRGSLRASKYTSLLSESGEKEIKLYTVQYVLYVNSFALYELGRYSGGRICKLGEY